MTLVLLAGGSATAYMLSAVMDEDMTSEPAVSPELYDADYYLSCCAGSKEWAASDGACLSGMYRGALSRVGLRPGEVVIDIGTGRGDMLAAALEAGARRAVGIDYSEAAIALAQRTLEVHGVADRADVFRGDARHTGLPGASADLVTMLDFVEHVTPDELHGALLEARRLLRPRGRLLVHTMPSRLVYSVTYAWQRRLRLSRWRSWPRDPRQEIERVMHINEQTPGSLRRSLRGAGFVPDVEVGRWIYTDFVPDARARRLYERLARWKLTARFGAADIWAVGRLR